MIVKSANLIMNLFILLHIHQLILLLLVNRVVQKLMKVNKRKLPIVRHYLKSRYLQIFHLRIKAYLLKMKKIMIINMRKLMVYSLYHLILFIVIQNLLNLYTLNILLLLYPMILLQLTCQKLLKCQLSQCWMFWT